jgi:hypothetical protein
LLRHTPTEERACSGGAQMSSRLIPPGGMSDVDVTGSIGWGIRLRGAAAGLRRWRGPGDGLQRRKMVRWIQMQWIRAAYPVDGVGGDSGLHWRNIRDEIGEEMSGHR